MMLEFGLAPFIASMGGDVLQMNDQVDSRAYRALLVIAQLQDSYEQLQQLKDSSEFMAATQNVETFCPNFDPTLISSILANSTTSSTTATGTTTNNSTIAEPEILADLRAILGLDPTTVRENVAAGLAQVGVFMDYDLESAADTLFQVTNFTASVDQGVDSMYSHDWMIKMGVVVVDVVTIFMAVGILINKHSIDYPAYQRLTTWVLLPVFCLAMALTIVSTCLFVSLAIANAGT